MKRRFLLALILPFALASCSLVEDALTSAAIPEEELEEAIDSITEAIGGSTASQSTGDQSFIDITTIDLSGSEETFGILLEDPAEQEGFIEIPVGIEDPEEAATTLLSEEDRALLGGSSNRVSAASMDTAVSASRNFLLVNHVHVSDTEDFSLPLRRDGSLDLEYSRLMIKGTGLEDKFGAYPTFVLEGTASFVMIDGTCDTDPFSGTEFTFDNIVNHFDECVSDAATNNQAISADAYYRITFSGQCEESTCVLVPNTSRSAGTLVAMALSNNWMANLERILAPTLSQQEGDSNSAVLAIRNSVATVNGDDISDLSSWSLDYKISLGDFTAPQ